MEFEFASPEDETPVRQLLAGCELPNEDITASHLEHFFNVWLNFLRKTNNEMMWAFEEEA